MTENNPHWGPQPPQPANRESFVKRHPVTTVFLILGAVAVLFFGGCVALIGGAVDEADKSTSSSQPKDPGPSKRDTEGVDKNERRDVESVTVKNEGYGVKSGKITIKNNSSKTSDYDVKVRYRDSSGKQVGTDWSYVQNVSPGETATDDVLLPPEDAATADVVSVDRTESVG